jgi:hypothetical protein
VTLLTDLDAFFTEHGRCGDLDAGVEAEVVWITCDCGGQHGAANWTRTTDPRPHQMKALSVPANRRAHCSTLHAGSPAPSYPPEGDHHCRH